MHTTAITADTPLPVVNELHSRLQIQYLGHAAFRLRSGDGKTVLIDPFVSGNPESPFEVSDLLDADLLLISHAAWDHLGDSVTILQQSGAIAVCAPEVHRYLAEKGLPAERLRLLVWGGAIDVSGVTVRSVEAHHVSHVWDGKQYLTGMPLSFIVYLAGLGVYHAGDTSIFSDLQLIGALYRPRIALIPVGAAPGFFAEMAPNEAALATMWLGAEVAIPMHFSDPAATHRFAAAVDALSISATVVQLRPGQTMSYSRDLSIGVS